MAATLSHPTRTVLRMAGGMRVGTGRSLIERLGLDPGVEPGSGVVIRQARSVEGEWLVQVSWVEVDPQRPGDAEHRVAWLPAGQVSPA